MTPPAGASGSSEAATTDATTCRLVGAAGDEGLRAVMDALDSVGAFDHSNDEQRDRAYVAAEVSAYAKWRAAAELEAAADVHWAEKVRWSEVRTDLRARAAALSSPASAVTADEGTRE